MIVYLFAPLILFVGLVGRMFANGPGFIRRLHHTKDFKNGSWDLLA